MPAGAIAAVFAAEMSPEIVNFDGHSASQNGREPTRPAAGVVAAARRQAGWRNQRLARRQPLEGRQAVRDVMEGLLVDGEDRHLRAAEDAWIVKRAGFQNHGG
jgi:hypothetical protein